MPYDHGLTFRHLQVVTTLHQTGTLAETGSKLNLSQSQASRNLQEVEAALGVKLFHRTRAGSHLTPAGEEIVPLIQDLMKSTDQVFARARRIAGGRAGTVRLGYTTYSTVTALTRAVKALAEQLPEVTLELVRGLDSEVERMVLEGQIDLALVHPPFAPQGLEMADLVFDPLAWIVPGDWQGPDPCPASAMIGREILIPPVDFWPYTFSLFMRRCEEVGASLKLVPSSYDASARMAYVAAGAGVSVCGAARQATLMEGVRLVAMDGFEGVGYRTALAWHGRESIPAVQRAAHIILGAFGV